MANVVTFDTERLLIIEIPVYADESPTPSPQTMLDNNTSMQEIYSEWKEFVNRSAGSPSTGSLGFPPAIRIVGGDPITDTQDLGITYFVTNGWRFKPAEGNHRWTIDGNVWTDPAGQSVFVSTDGPYTVNVETKVSNLVDSSVARLDLAQLLNAVYIDTVRGVAGTGTIGGTQIGTPTLPSNNIVDATTIAVSFNIRNFKLSGAIILIQGYPDWNFEGLAAAESSSVDVNGQDVNGSRFAQLELTGDCASAEFEADDCTLDNLLNISGHFSSCGFHSNLRLGTNAHCVFDSCFSEVPGNNVVVVDWNGAHHANFRNYSGGVEVQNMAPRSPEAIASFDLDPGTLIVGPTNTGGSIKVRGVGEFDSNLLGSPSPVVDDSELVRGSDVQTTRKLAQNRTHTDPNTGIMTVFDDNDVDIFLQGDLFEDVAATQPYRGQGAERRERLI
jgi:hypothetical protein